MVSNLLYALHFHPDYDAQAILAEHRRWGRQFTEPLADQIRPHPNDRSPERMLRLGKVPRVVEVQREERGPLAGVGDRLAT